MSSTPPPTPAGWYDEPNGNGGKRYWDGQQWTDHTAPQDAVPSSQSPVTGISPKARTWIIVGSVVAGLVLVSSIAGAIGRSGDSERAGMSPSNVAAAPEPSVAPSTDPEPEQPSPPSQAPPATFDLARFTSSANGNLDDFTKDLDDMVVTVNEGGFWRLLSNSVELSFNLGQLQGTDAPPSIASAWDAELLKLSNTIDVIDAAVADDDTTAIRQAIEASRAQVNVLRGLVSQAS